ncbi:MAG: PT domain-containing protein [Anaerolineae bacterium]
MEKGMLIVRRLGLLAGLVGLAIVALLAAAGGHDGAGAATCWQANITEQSTNLDLAGSVLRVSVEGKGGLPVRVRSRGGFETINYTGTKPEYGPFVAEFAPLNKGTYFVEPEGLGLVFEVWLDGRGYTRVDFRPIACPPTATPDLPQAQPTATKKTQATKAATATPSPTAAPAQAAGWRARIVERLTDKESYYSTIAVHVVGRPAGQQVEIRSDPWSQTCTTGTKPEIGPDACEFGALRAGTYHLTPAGLGAQIEVSVELHEFVLVEFYYAGPAETVRWTGSIVENKSGSQPTEHYASAIAVVVAGKPWHEVEIQAGDYQATCTTGYKPEYGPDACEFGGLAAGTYTIRPKDLDASLQITVDGWGWAMVRFDAVKAPAPAAQPTATPTPKKNKPTSQPTSQPAKQSTPTASPTPSPTRGPSTGWHAWIVTNTRGQQDGTGVWSVLIVRVLKSGGVPVRIRTEGGFEATCITGAKPEIGPDACDFGGLWPGTYFVRPDGSDVEVEIEMDGLGWAEVHFGKP